MNPEELKAYYSQLLLKMHEGFRVARKDLDDPDVFLVLVVSPDIYSEIRNALLYLHGTSINGNEVLEDLNISFQPMFNLDFEMVSILGSIVEVHPKYLETMLFISELTTLRKRIFMADSVVQAMGPDFVENAPPPYRVGSPEILDDAEATDVGPEDTFENFFFPRTHPANPINGSKPSQN